MGKPKGYKVKERKYWISKDEKSKMVPESQLLTYLNDGWYRGHVTDKQKEQNKKWYNN